MFKKNFSKLFRTLSNKSYLNESPRDFPEGLKYFRDATLNIYEQGLEEWQKKNPNAIWANYMAFLSTGWYQDGLMAWRNMSWRSKSKFRNIYDNTVNDIGSNYMIEWRTHTLLWFAASVNGVDGDFVEFGTGKGWMATAIANANILDNQNKRMFLFDTFQPEKVDPLSGSRIGFTDPHYAHTTQDVSEKIYSNQRFEMVVGDVYETLIGALELLQSISFAHFDLNAAQVEEYCFKLIYSKLTSRSIIVLDDYGFVDLKPQQETWDRLALTYNFDILTLPTGQGIIQITK